MMRFPTSREEANERTELWRQLAERTPGIKIPEYSDEEIKAFARMEERTRAFLESYRRAHAGGRPKNKIDRDALLACLRDCYGCEYEQPRPGLNSIREVFEAVGLKMPEGKAREAAIGRGRRRRGAVTECDHHDLIRLINNAPTT